MLLIDGKCKDFQHVEMRDVEFSNWLRSKGWQGECHPAGNTWGKFHVGFKTLAIVKYDNQECERKIFINTKV
jgi:hypothetical protein